MRGLLQDTLSEMWDRKIIWVFAIITLLGLLAIFAARATDIQIQGHNLDLDDMPDFFNESIVRGFNVFAYILVFFSVMATASLLPNMLIRGRAEYYLSKSIARHLLLTYKVVSVWMSYGAMIAVATLIQFVAVGLAFGVWETNVVHIILIHWLILAVWLSIVSLAGIMSGSNALSLMAAFVVWIVQYLLSFKDFLEALGVSETLMHVVTALYYVVPKTGDMTDQAVNLATGGAVNWMVINTSLAFAGVMFVITLLLFRRKDY